MRSFDGLAKCVDGAYLNLPDLLTENPQPVAAVGVSAGGLVEAPPRLRGSRTRKFMHYMRGAGRSVRPAPRARPQDHQGLSRREGGRPAPAVGTGTRSGCSSTTAGEAGGEPASVGAVRRGHRARLPRVLSVVYSWPAQPRVAAALRALPPGGQAARRGDRTSSGAGGPVGLARGQQAHP